MFDGQEEREGDDDNARSCSVETIMAKGARTIMATASDPAMAG